MLPRSLASAWRSSVATLQTPKGPGLFTSAWINSGHDKTDSPEQKKGLVTDPDLAPPKPESGKHDTPSSKKTNELVLPVTQKPCNTAAYSRLFIQQTPVHHHWIIQLPDTANSAEEECHNTCKGSLSNCIM
ncbi:hypothetical protein ABBQ32_005015 [Trebouxia sp. C0010 RCD-2024]